jgi:hypothetical protein
MNDEKNLFWINSTTAKIEIALENNEDRWILGNLDFMGYYRVNYDTQNWLKIISQLKSDHRIFSAVERAALIFDSFTFARFYLFYYSIFDL